MSGWSPIKGTEEAQADQFHGFSGMVENTAPQLGEAFRFAQSSQESSALSINDNNSQVRTQPHGTLASVTDSVYVEPSPAPSAAHHSEPSLLTHAVSWAHGNILPTYPVEAAQSDSIHEVENQSATCELSPSMEVLAGSASACDHLFEQQVDVQSSASLEPADDLAAIHVFELSQGLSKEDKSTEEYSETEENPNVIVEEPENTTSFMYPMKAAIIANDVTEASAAMEVVMQSEEEVLCPVSGDDGEAGTVDPQPTGVDFSDNVSNALFSPHSSHLNTVASAEYTCRLETYRQSTKGCFSPQLEYVDLKPESHSESTHLSAGEESPPETRLTAAAVVIPESPQCISSPAHTSETIGNPRRDGTHSPIATNSVKIQKLDVPAAGNVTPVKQIQRSIPNGLEEESRFTRVTRGRDIIIPPDDASVLQSLRKQKAEKTPVSHRKQKAPSSTEKQTAATKVTKEIFPAKSPKKAPSQSAGAVAKKSAKSKAATTDVKAGQSNMLPGGKRKAVQAKTSTKPIAQPAKRTLSRKETPQKKSKK